MHAHEVYAYKVHAYEMHAYESHAYEMDLRCNNIRNQLLAFPDGRFKSTNGGPKIDPVTREERNINTHALLLSPCLCICSMEVAEPQHLNLFGVYSGISAEEAESWSMHEFEDIEVHQSF
jgi:hypothetical protein